jgi:hypothetical protein
MPREFFVIGSAIKTPVEEFFVFYSDITEI